MCNIHISNTHVTKESIPDNWLEKLQQFDISNAKLSNAQKAIFEYIKEYILDREARHKDGKLFILNSLVQFFIKDIIIKGKTNLLSCYNDLPEKLITEAMQEIGNCDIRDFNNKLHSVFVEFLTYQHLIKEGYEILNCQRSIGSCDLTMKKDGQTYQFEIKFKQNDDIFASRVLDAIRGYALLSENAFCRDKFFTMVFKSDNLHKNFPDMIEEVGSFMQNKQELYKGKCIDIKPMKYIEKNRDVNTVCLELEASRITNEFACKESAKKSIKTIFTGEDRHINNIVNKYQKNQKKYQESQEKFAGFISWSIPFHKEVDFKVLEEAFQEVLSEEKVEFDMHVLIDQLLAPELSYYFVYKPQTAEID